MFPELNNLLNTTPDKAEQGKLTLLCDAKTDGSFLVHHFLSFYLKANCKVCFVALVQSFSHYNIVGQKLGWNSGPCAFEAGVGTTELNPWPWPLFLSPLGHHHPRNSTLACEAQAWASVLLARYCAHMRRLGGISLTVARERGQLVFLEALKSSVDIFFQTPSEPQPLQFLREASAGDLRPLYAFVREALKPGDDEEASWRPPVLLVDDLSVLLSLGMGAVAVLDFIHYCRATVCAELKGSHLLPCCGPIHKCWLHDLVSGKGLAFLLTFGN
ncbi:elongator complex protein 6 isoform X2 [Heterocephalus glaber]|uniref:Elongator complex protein 6 n=1 Tax=Heterocephalus glaber TaxID=10181 RepID=A0AAX6SVK6_HETGA|nr:elongator complex protein 6 isoform X2 [Heterocephalus glaber]